MRLTALTIKNFKGIDEHGVRVEFAPITLLFGPNNAGKSTVIQALHLAREVFCHPDMDLDTVDVQGNGFDLGSFQDYVHKHDLDRIVHIGLEMETDGLAAYNDDYVDGWQAVDDLLHQVRSCAVEIGIRWNMKKTRAELTEYIVFLNGKRFTNVHIEPHDSMHISLCNTIVFLPKESILKLTEEADNLWEYIEKNPDDYGNEFHDFCVAIKDTLPEFVRPFADFHQLVIELGGPDLPLAEDQRIIEISLNGKVAPEWDSSLPLEYEDIDSDSEYPGEDFTVNCLNLFSSLVLGPGACAKKALHDLLYIGPLRSIPERRELRAQKPSRERWANGQAAWDMLATATGDQLQVINHRLNSADFLTTGYAIARKRNLPLDADGALALALRQTLLEDFDENALPLLRKFLDQSPEIRFALRNEKNGVEVDPHDMGVGISQIIPVVVAATLPKHSAVIAIEQPELHIHPAWQTALGDIFIQAVQKENPSLFLLETHSEHLMLRLLRRIRETHEGELPSGFPETRPEMLSVLYVQPKDDNHTEIIRIPVTSDGDFGQKWPNGFFAERAKELF